MANSRSALKRVRQNEARNTRNTDIKTRVKTLRKKTLAAAAAGDKDAAAKSFQEFTSVVDRSVAKSCSMAVRRYVDQNSLKNLVFASCHRDIIEWLQPDWVFDTDTGELSLGKLKGQKFDLSLYPAQKKYGQSSANIII